MLSYKQSLLDIKKEGEWNYQHASGNGIKLMHFLAIQRDPFRADDIL